MAYFDNAATTFPKPACVYEQMDDFYRKSGGNAGRGNHKIAVSSGQLISETRNLICELLYCPSKQVIFTPSATVALNMILQGLIKMGCATVYISPFEHNAVTRVLHAFEQTGQIKVRHLIVNDDLEYDIQRIRYQFDEERPDLLVVSHASNVIGLIAPAKELFSLAKRYSAYTVLDMAQTAGLVEENLGLAIYDFAVFAGHKTLYGPTGISGFVMNPEIDLPPILYGGTGYDSANQSMPNSLPEKYEMGTINISGIAGLNAALKWHKEIGFAQIAAIEKENRTKLTELLKKYPFLTIQANHSDRDYVGIVSCTIDDISSDSAAPIFSEKNIAVRTGLQCAPLAHMHIGTYPAGTIRFSVGYFTSEQDFRELEDALDYIEENL